MRRSPALAGILFALACLPVAHAATLCGTVRDSATQSPVALAGIFLYQDNQYAGLYGATDQNGAFCIDGIPNGIYDVQVRVDDYATAWMTGVVVDDATSVDLWSGAPVELLTPYPNPASDHVTIGFRVRETMPVTLEIFDLRGRLIHGWEGNARAGDTTIRYGFVDANGQRLASGLYFLRLRAADRTITRRVRLVQ